MRKVILLLIGALLTVASGNVEGAITWDSGHHVFTEGSETFVNMFNDASAEISGGYIAEFSMYDNTTADITGGQISILWGQGSSSVDVYAGSDISLLRPNDSSTSNVYDGQINHLFVLGDSITNIYGGEFEQGLSANDSALIMMYAENIFWDPEGGSGSSFGVLSGTWLSDGDPFTIDYVDIDCFDHIVFIPEPSTILLIGLDGLILRA